MLNEALNGLNIKPDGVYLDGTLGGGGHSREILAGLSLAGRLFAVDRDADAINNAGQNLNDERVTLIRGNFSEVLDNPRDYFGSDILFDGMLFDLGVSSHQLDTMERGFSFKGDNPIDMRMDQSSEFSAKEIVNEWPYEELKRIFYTYGEERYAPQIAKRIVEARDREPITTTLQLTNLLKSHPKRVYQALRIATNDELGSLERMLERLPDRLAIGGRAVIISFHSLEDRLVKNAFKNSAKLGVITKHPVTPGEMELASNPRSGSAKLRVAERIQEQWNKQTPQEKSN
jgi:16S rRNA (cytosine1402-N4)-methyltransferase